MKSKYIIIICLLFLFTLCFYVESNAKDKHEDIIKVKEVYLKVVDKKYIGSSGPGIDFEEREPIWYNYGARIKLYFMKNSLIINAGDKYAVLPLNNIKGLDKTKSSYDIFKLGANPNVSSIIPCDSCNFEQYQDKLMMINDSSCKSDNNSNSQIQLSLLDDNGYMNKGTIKYIPCIAKERIFEYIKSKWFTYSRYYISYDAEIYYAVVLPYIHRTDECSFLITSEDVILQGKYDNCYSSNGRYNDTNLPFSMSPDITKFAMVDDEYNKIRLYTFDNKSIKTNVLTDIKAESNKTRLFLHNNGYLHVIRLGFFTTTSEVYKINDFSKPDGYIYAGINTPLTYYGLYEDAKYRRSYNLTDYFKIEDNTVYRIFKEGSLSEVYDIAISYDMTVAFKAVCGKDSYSCDIYLYSLEPVDANEKGVENQNK